ncbi:hypothetical protein KEM56_002520, partial [Ascosphaera pollenicola]
MKGALSAAVFSALAVKEAAATFGWGFDDPRAVCDDNQQQGFDFSDSSQVSKRNLQDWTFNQMQHESCSKFDWAKEWHGKNALHFTIGGENSADLPFIEAYGRPFYWSELSLIAESEVELELQFKMPDYSICTQTVKCGPTPTTIKNENCGGAVGLGFGWSASSDNTDNTGIDIGNGIGIGGGSQGGIGVAIGS